VVCLIKIKRFNYKPDSPLPPSSKVFLADRLAFLLHLRFSEKNESFSIIHRDFPASESHLPLSTFTGMFRKMISRGDE
jgi:hypothetical protein